jgi:Tetratricopeptide repeat
MIPAGMVERGERKQTVGASVLLASRLEPLGPFTYHRRSGSHVRYHSLVELRAVYMPDAARSVSGYPIYEQSFGPEHTDVAVGLFTLALLLQFTSRFTEPLLRRALAILEKVYRPDHPVANGVLAVTHREEEAEQLFRRALAIHEKTYGAEHTSVAHDLSILAQLLQSHGCQGRPSP